MSSPPDSRSLEALVEDNWDVATPAMIAILEPYREDVEDIARDYDEDCQSWRDYRSAVWSPVPDEVSDRVSALTKTDAIRGDTRKPREPDASATCVNCAAPLVRRRNEANWNFLRRSACSRRCAAQRSAGTAKAYRPKDCRRCNRPFTPHGSHVMYCAKCAKNKPTASRKHYLLKVIEAPLEAADYNRLVAAQGRGCAVCERHKPLHLHRPDANGPVKGMLCSKCIRVTKLITTAIVGRFAAYMKSATIQATTPPHNGTDTSAAAAESMKRLTLGLCGRVLSAIRGRHSEGMTCDEAEVALGLTHQTCSARFNELVGAKAIFDVGRRKTRSGRMAKVYVARV